MGIRKEIKAVISEYGAMTISQVAAINAISNIVARPKPPKTGTGATLAEEAVAAAQEHIDETGLKGRKHDVLVLTLTHFCDEEVIKAKVDHESDPDPELVALAIATLQQFSMEKFGRIVGPLKFDEVAEFKSIAEILKKF